MQNTNCLRLFVWLLSLALAGAPVYGQNVLPANDGTGTIVTLDGNRFDIQGGTLSGEAANLFHSFEQFGLDTGQIANFMSDPQISNILARVVGGDPSMIDGLIQVTGGHANLFLMNPTGIVFGSNARLNVPANFSATTATGIGFDGDHWFDAFGDNHYQDLNGSPTQYALDQDASGSIINAGDLAVPAQQDLTLLGSRVINTGNISAPEGNVTIAAVQGSNRVRIDQEGCLLSLEIEPPRDSEGQMLPFNATDLAVLLTEGADGLETGLAADADGTVSLTASGTTVPTEAGTTITSGHIDATGEHGGSIHLLGDKVGVIDGRIDASGTHGGGTVWVGGGYQGQGAVPNASQTLVGQAATIHADALVDGNGGNVVVWADETTQFYGSVTARGGASGGDGGLVEVSGANHLDYRGTVDTLAPMGTTGTLLLDPTNIAVVETGGHADSLEDTDEFADPDLYYDSDTDTYYTYLDNDLIDNASSNVTLQATNDIVIAAPINMTTPDVGLTAQANGGIAVISGTADEIRTNGGDIVLQADNDGDGIGNFYISQDEARLQITTNGGDFTGQGAYVELYSPDINTDGGNITLTGTGNESPGTTNGGNGISLLDGTILETTGNGSIELSGTGGVSDSNRMGVYISGTDTIVRAQNGDITITGRGDTDGAGSGTNEGIHIDGGALVETTGDGAIHLAGTGGNGVSGNMGVLIRDEGSTIRSQNGDITITGVGGSNTAAGNSDGVSVYNGAEVSTTGTGNIGITGTGGSGTVDNQGIAIGSTAAALTSSIHTNDGNITLEGTGTGTVSSGNVYDNHGVFIFGNASIAAGGTGGISMQGTGANNAPGIMVTDELGPSDSQLVITTGAGGGAINLFADEIDLSGPLQVSGTGTMNLQPMDTETDISVGGTVEDERFNVTDAELALLGDTFSQLIIGSEQFQGTITVESDGVSLGSDTTLQSSSADPDASIVVDGGIQTNGYDLALEAGGTVDINADINTSGGTLGITGGGTIDTTGSVSTNGGYFFIEGQGGVTLSGPVQTNGGDIDVSGAEINAAGITLSSASADEAGGNIWLYASTGGITTGNLESTGISAGNIMLDAVTTISTGEIDASASLGDGGDVTLDPMGDVGVISINTQGGDVGIGGTVDITTDAFFRATGSFIDQNGTWASISSAGGAGAGAITIRHGGQADQPFTVGDAQTNGTAASITSGASTIEPVTEIPFVFQEGNIRIIGMDAPAGTTDLMVIPQFFVESGEPLKADLPLPEIEDRITGDYEAYLNLPDRPIKGLGQVRKDLQRIEQITGVRPAVIYALFLPAAGAAAQSTVFSKGTNDRLELILVTSRGLPTRQVVDGVTKGEILATVQKLRSLIRDMQPPETYLPQARRLYGWLVRPLAEDLSVLNIDHLLFVMDAGLRSLPLAALHDGQDFILRKYSVGMVPSLSLTDMRYVGVRNMGLLAMGATRFSDLPALPGVKTELETILDLWPVKGKPLINETFTLKNIGDAVSSKPFGIVHFATHAAFEPGSLSNSYIQLSGERLTIDQIRTLKLHDPPMELLSFSACETALGDYEAELGFAGIATKAGVKSALGSLWKVADRATLGLMTCFYNQLRQPDTKIKAKALQRAQLEMIDGDVYQDGNFLVTRCGRIPLPAAFRKKKPLDFRHPFYWSGFTLIGSPW